MDRYAAFTAEIEIELLRDLVRYWNEKRGDRAMPGRPDLDPLEMKRFLRYVSLYDVQANPPRYYCRVDGSKQVDLFGVDCTGRHLDEAMSAEHVAMAHISYGAVVESFAPRRHKRAIEYNNQWIEYECVILPLSTSGERVEMLMVGIVEITGSK